MFILKPKHLRKWYYTILVLAIKNISRQRLASSLTKLANYFQKVRLRNFTIVLTKVANKLIINNTEFLLYSQRHDTISKEYSENKKMALGI